VSLRRKELPKSSEFVDEEKHTLSRPFTGAPVTAQADGCQPLSVSSLMGNRGGTAEHALRPHVDEAFFV